MKKNPTRVYVAMNTANEPVFMDTNLAELRDKVNAYDGIDRIDAFTFQRQAWRARHKKTVA